MFIKKRAAVSAVLGGIMTLSQMAAVSVPAYADDGEKEAYYVNADTGTVDLAMFMGQSNMAGRGEAVDSVVCEPGHGYEFRAVSDPTKLYDVTEPFGKNENRAVNDGTNKSGSMVSALMESYYQQTGVPIVGVSSSQGGTQIDYWQPGGAAIEDSLKRLNDAKTYLLENGYKIGNCFMVWCQGESDGDADTPLETYVEKTKNMAQEMITQGGIDKCFMVRIGHKNGSTKYDEIISAQSKLCNDDDRFIMASEKFTDMEGYMKDPYHYHQTAYNIVGADAAASIASYYYPDTKPVKPDTDTTGEIAILSNIKTDTETGITIDAFKTGVAVCTVKASDGRLKAMKVYEPSEKAQTITFDNNTVEQSDTVELMNWDSLNGMTPVSGKQTVKVSDIKALSSATTDDFVYGNFSNSEKYEHDMPYRYILPANYDSSKSYPLLMYLHGAGRRGTDNANQLNNPKPLFDNLLSEENINKYPCIIVAPQCPSGEQWVDVPWGKGTYKVDEVQASDEIEMARDIVLDFENRFSVDTDRIYIAGQSMGGYGTWDMIMRNPDMFAAAVPQCGAADTTKAASLKNMAIWAHHGEADTTVPISGSRDMVAALKEAGSTNVRYTQYPNIGHEVQVEAFKDVDLIPWMFSKSKAANAEVKDDYTYLRVNDDLVRTYSEPRPVKQDGKIYVPAKTAAEKLGFALSGNTISNNTASLELTAENSITVNNALMADVNAITAAFDIVSEFDEVSNTVIIKSTIQREGALRIENAFASQSIDPAMNAVDGKADTRWTAMVNDNNPENTLTVDLGEKKSVSAVEINFYLGEAREYDFDIKVSNDGENWTKVNTFKSGKKKGFERFEFDAVNAQYVQFVGRGSTVNGTKNAYNSIWEFEAYGKNELEPEETLNPTQAPTEKPNETSEPTQAPTDKPNETSEPTQAPTDKPEDYRKLDAAAVSASGRQNDDYTEANAIDGDINTRWNAFMGIEGNQKPQWISIDLGEKKCVSSVNMLFYQPSARLYNFEVQVSDDGNDYKKAGSFSSKAQKTNESFESFKFEPVNGRYVRIYFTSANATNGTVLQYIGVPEIEVYGSDNLLPEAGALNIVSAEASASQKDAGPELAIDGDTNTRWAASVTDAKPENTFTADLGEVKNVSAVKINFYSGNQRKYDFDIKVSLDGVKWKSVGTYNSSGSINGMETFEFSPINTRYIQYCGRGSVLADGSKNIYNSFWEFSAIGYEEPKDSSPNAPSADDMPEIIVENDDETTTTSSIGLKWSFAEGETPDDVKYYRVERVSDGITEFRTDGEVSAMNYVDSGNAQRPKYGPYESDYTINLNGKYYIADLNDMNNPLSDAGSTTKVYDSYEGIPLVAGGSYDYIVTGYNASGETVARSQKTTLRTKADENTASIVFSGTPTDGFKGYNMSVSSVTNMEQAEYGGYSGWHFIKDCNINSSNLGLILDDNSGLTNADEDTSYLVKITWSDKFWNSAALARLNLPRTANESYNQSNYNDWKNYMFIDAGSYGENNKWYTREVMYTGKNLHKLLANGAAADLVINANYAGNYGRFYIKSIEITKWNGDEERPFEISPASMFTDNMIIQRDKEINIWGRLDGIPQNNGEFEEAAMTAELIDGDGTVVSSGTAVSANTRRGDWSILMNAVSYEPNKTYTLRLTAEMADGEKKNIKEFTNIILGDVYLCAGQSNMRYGPEYKAWTDYRQDIDSGYFDNDNVRIISNENKTVSNYWETDTKGWKVSNAENMYDISFSATAAYFGKHLYEGNGNIPVGLISSAVGGASIETFLVNPVNDESGNQIYKGNSALYNRLIYPYTNWSNEDKNGIGLAGIIWYQGEADANSTKMSMSTYTKAMEQMVNDYRTVFNDESLPFMYVQLAAFDNPSGEYAAMREAQFNYMKGINTNNGVPENVGMAVITDNTDNIKDIHPRNKNEVGRRLSLWARKLVYKQDDVEYSGPIFESAQTVEEDGHSALEISFEEGSVMNGLKLRDDALVGMKIAGADKNFVTVSNYRISDDGKSLIVWSDDLENPEYVQYGYYKLPTDASLMNNDDLPASAFRNYED